jgi:hypothetical protein
MIKILIVLLLFINLYSKDLLLAQKQNTLYVQNLIDIEEKIALNFEKYLLTEFKFPKLEDLITNSYLGANFSNANKFGSQISFVTETGSTNRLRIKYAVTSNVESYIKELYNRDLYRFNTHAYSNEDISYVQIKLQSKEAETIYKILSSGGIIEKNCQSTLVNRYCNIENSIRWYNGASNWIEYSKKDFEDGNVTVVSNAVLTDTKLNNLKIGTYIFVENSSKYVKYIDNKILKVD